MKLMCVFLLFILVDIVCGSLDLQVEIQDGKLVGKILKSIEGRDFIGFQGIPYAEPPVGNLRFKSPIPKKPWTKVRDATRPHPVCPQQDSYLGNRVEGDEDCLFLNVYTPNISPETNELLPVMVFFHGGGFLCGSASSEWYSPGILLDQDIVLVTVNYRLGPLGFLSTGDEALPGNYGLKDQSLALRWVNKNIKSFGGDSKSVTIFGQSAGGASVNLHMFSPLSKGLFHKVISQSGTASNAWATASVEDSIKNTRKLAEAINCSRSKNEEMVECFRLISPHVLMGQDHIFKEWGKLPMMPFRAVVEPASDEGFLVENVEKLLDTGNFYDVPWMVGLTTHEGLFFAIDLIVNPTLVQELNEDFGRINTLFEYHGGLGDMQSLNKRIREFYFENRIITLEQDFKNLTDMLTDCLMTWSVDMALRNHLKKAKMPIYTYLFAYQAGVSFSQMFGSPELKGVCHNDDLRYLFPIVHKVPVYKDVTERDEQVKNLMTDLWVNFAREGNPTPKNFDPEIPKWGPLTSERIEYYHIDGPKPKMESGLVEGRVKFWRTVQYESKIVRDKEL